MSFFEDLKWRGLIHQTTHPEQIQTKLDAPGSTVYIGFDPTAVSLHVGSLVPLVMLARFQRAGHRAIAVVGGGTGLIGDPSGRTAERLLLTQERLELHLAGIREQVARIVVLSDSKRGILVDNSSWLCAFSLIDFLRDVGKHFSVNMMLEKDSVKNRLEQRDQGLSFTEFSYMLLQGYDFLHLYRHEGCSIQVGGSDQWGNITAGMDLIRRVTAGEAYGLTLPLVTRSDGTKFGKSEGKNIWLSPSLTSPYQFYQFFIRVDDQEVGRFLRTMTFLPREEIEALDAEVQAHPEARKAQQALAREVTTLVHGKDVADKAQRAAEVLFGGALDDLDEQTLLEIFADAPSSDMPRSRLEAGLSLVDALTETQLSSSKGMARKEIKGGGIYVNNVRTDDRMLTPTDLVAARYLLLRKGKKNYHLLRVG